MNCIRHEACLPLLFVILGFLHWLVYAWCVAQNVGSDFVSDAFCLRPGFREAQTECSSEKSSERSRKIGRESKGRYSLSWSTLKHKLYLGRASIMETKGLFFLPLVVLGEKGFLLVEGDSLEKTTTLNI
jgi:hypothetical protein